jgi:hypothetical protein
MRESLETKPHAWKRELANGEDRRMRVNAGDRIAKLKERRGDEWGKVGDIIDIRTSTIILLSEDAASSRFQAI